MHKRLKKVCISYKRISENHIEKAKNEIIDIIETYTKLLDKIEEDGDQSHLNEIEKVKRVIKED